MRKKVHAIMEQKERAQFQKLADYLFAAVPELLNTIVPEVTRAKQAMEEVANAIYEGREAAETPEVREDYDATQRAQYILYTRTLDLVTQALQQIDDRSPTAVRVDISETSSPAELAAAERELRAIGYGLSISKFFLGLLLITLHASVAEYTDGCEAFLGREIGSHDARRRVGGVVKEILLAVPGLFVPALGFLGAAIEALKQLRATPQRQDLERVKKTVSERDRLVIFRNLASELKEHFWYVEGTVKVSVDGALLR
jgi:hypothetical protein